MAQPTESIHLARLERALALVDAGSSIKKAARDTNLTFSTLQRRVAGGATRSEHYEKMQKLSNIQESQLVKWLQQMQGYGFPCTSSMIRSMATNLSGVIVAKSWITNFIRRHPEIRFRRLPALERARSQVTPTSIGVFFDRYESLRLKYEIQDSDIWNMDEMGIHIGQSSRFKQVIVTSEGGKQSFTVPSTSTKLITVIEAINTAGNLRIPPLFITEGKVFTESLCPNETITRTFNFQLARTANAFTTSATTLEWLNKCFLPYSKPQSSDSRPNSRYRILILDGHISHISDQFFDLCCANRVIPLFLPAHATHIMQPLDLVVFGHLKRLYHDELYKHTCDGNLRIDYQVFFTIYSQVRPRALSERSCRAAFREAGLIPIDRARCLSKLPKDSQNTVESQNAAAAAALALQDYTSIRPTDLLQLSRQLLNNNQQREADCLLLKTAESRDSWKCQYILAQATINRLQNELEDNRRQRQSTRRVRASPQSRFLSRRAVARSQGQIVSSPPSSPLRLREIDSLVQYEAL